jgi:hypothetical protein
MSDLEKKRKERIAARKRLGMPLDDKELEDPSH